MLQLYPRMPALWRPGLASTRHESGDPRRLRKRENARPIDLSVALALAVWRVSVGGGSNVYEEGGLLIV